MRIMLLFVRRTDRQGFEAGQHTDPPKSLTRGASQAAERRSRAPRPQRRAAAPRGVRFPTFHVRAGRVFPRYIYIRYSSGDPSGDRSRGPAFGHNGCPGAAGLRAATQGPARPATDRHVRRLTTGAVRAPALARGRARVRAAVTISSTRRYHV